MRFCLVWTRKGDLHPPAAFFAGGYDPLLRCDCWMIMDSGLRDGKPVPYGATGMGFIDGGGVVWASSPTTSRKVTAQTLSGCNPSGFAFLRKASHQPPLQGEVGAERRSEGLSGRNSTPHTVPQTSHRVLPYPYYASHSMCLFRFGSVSKRGIPISQAPESVRREPFRGHVFYSSVSVPRRIFCTIRRAAFPGVCRVRRFYRISVSDGLPWCSCG